MRFMLLFLPLVLSTALHAQTLEQQLQAEKPGNLAAAAMESGDAKRGAILFHQPHIGCVKCHAINERTEKLGPDLLQREPHRSDSYLVKSVLNPSADILKGYETRTVVTAAGKSVTGLLVKHNDDSIILRDPTTSDRITIAADDIDEIVESKLSIMPTGLANQLTSRQQFLDLMSYVIMISRFGESAARDLQPPVGAYTLKLPEYEARVDHAGLLAKLNDEALQRGEAIYSRLCINCHGNKQRPGSLPTALRFGEGKFKHGSDPHTMYKTLTQGFGFMVPQTWMVPQQKYDVIHYIRETYLKKDNTSQFVAIDNAYLASLPKGDTFGPEPVEYAPWSDMNYGPSMINTFEVGNDGSNFAHKGIAVRLDSGPGGVSKGNRWAIFDHDTMRLAAAWTRSPNSKDSGFINWRGIHFDGRHGTHPRIAGDLQFANPNGPGWAKPGTADFTDDQRVVGRDDNLYGPLPRDWARYTGLHTLGDQTIIEYTVGGRRILERLGAVDVSSRRSPRDERRTDEKQTTGQSRRDATATNDRPNADLPDKQRADSSEQTAPLVPRRATAALEHSASDDDYVVFTRTMSIGTSPSPNMMLVATHPDEDTSYRRIGKYSAIISPADSGTKQVSPARFGGASHLRIDRAEAFDLTGGDFSIAARIRTTEDGVIFSKCNADGPWTPGAQALFIRDGRLTYDIGWVGAVTSKKKVADGKWHFVMMTIDGASHRVRFFVDGRPSGGGILRPKRKMESRPVAKIGFAAGDFPETSHFTGDIAAIATFDSDFSEDASSLTNIPAWSKSSPLAMWILDNPARVEPLKTVKVKDGADPLTAVSVMEGSVESGRSIFAGVVGSNGSFALSPVENQLLLDCPSGADNQNVVVWTAAVPADRTVDELRDLEAEIVDRIQPDDLQARIDAGGNARWPETLTTVPVLGNDSGPFTVDELTPPSPNPWLARMRLSGHDFYDDGDRVAVCSWDGDVWMVSGLKSLQSSHHSPSDQPRGEEKQIIGLVRSDKGVTATLGAPTLRWRRIASGLFQPLGLKIVAGDIYVTCRDQLVILRDRNDDGETDFYECFNNDHQVTPHFHEFAMGLQRDVVGNFYYAKSARHAKTALVPHHGTLLRIPSDGSRTDILATGFRAANGVCLNPDGTFIVTDQEGHWNPKNRINWVKEGGFYGNMYGYHDVTDDSDEAMVPPLCWITNKFDRSPSELMWIDNHAWGPLDGSLLNLSYGYGKVYVVPHENKDGQMQGGMCEFPIPQFPTGIHRGRIHAADNGLYVCGLFAWASSQQAKEGGFYRIRPTGKPAHLPVGLSANSKQMSITFSDPVDPKTATDVSRYSVNIWDIKRSASYGSKHYNEHEISVTSATVSNDNRTVNLTIPKLAPTWCMEIKCRLKSEEGEDFERVIHNTIHSLD